MIFNKYNLVMNEFIKTIPDKYYMFVITKCCGFEELVIVLKSSTVGELQKTLIDSVGSMLYRHIYFKNKNNNDSEERLYFDNTNINTLQLVSDFIKNLRLVYTIDECPYSVYQLYYDYECFCQPLTINNVVETNENMDIYENELSSTNNIIEPAPPATPRELIREFQEINVNTNSNFVLEPLQIPENIELEELEYCLRPPCLRREVTVLPRVSETETVTSSYNCFSYDLDYIV
jgi:hypothetical protein